MQRSFVRSMLSILVTLSLGCVVQLQLFSGAAQPVPIAYSDDDLGRNIADRTSDSADSQPPPSRIGSPRMEEVSEDLADYSIAQGSLVRVAPTQSLNLSRLRPGSSFSGVLVRPLFSQDREAVPVGSRIQLVVEKVEREKRAENASRRLVRRLWNPVSTKPAAFSVVFQSAVLVLPDERTLPATVSFGRMFNSGQARARSKQARSASESSGEQLQNGTKATQTLVESLSTTRKAEDDHRQILILKLENPIDLRLPREVMSANSTTEEQATVAGNFCARVSLLTQLSASLSREGDWFRARLVEPLQIDEILLPEGSMFEGRVSRRTPPRRLRRPGTLYVNFERIVPPTGLPIAISSSIVSVETDRRAAPKMDSEGMLRGRAPGVAAFAVDVGVSYLSGKLIDDLLEEGIKAAAAGTTSETAASIGRYFGVATGLCLFLMRRGNDVSLEPYSEFEVSFKPQVQPLTR
jgi:hypothetical protein